MGSALPERFMQALYTRYNRLIYAVIRQYLPQADCEDAAQDVVERLCKHVDTLQILPEAAVSAYIAYTAKHTALNALRHKEVVQRRTAQVRALERVEVWDGMEQALEDRDRLCRVWPMLSEEDQELLYRKYVFGQSNEELADIFDCKKDSIRTKLMRARRKALSLLNQEEDYDKKRAAIGKL